ncbi:MAG: M16 family metallopeptidase [Candidatus Melainabacteria bacterium]
MADTLTLTALNVEDTTLGNGARLLYQHAPMAPRLAISLFLPGGNLADAIPGQSDLVDRLVMKGTQTRSQEDIAIEIDGMTLDLDVDTRRDSTTMQATLLAEDLEPSLELMADIFFNATLSEFDREKEKMNGEILMELDSPRARASDHMIRSVFEGTQYATVSSVVLETLETMTDVSAARRQYQANYHPGNAIISVAGNVEKKRLTQLLEKYFPAGANPTPFAGDTVTEAVRQAIAQRTLKADRLVTFARDDSSQAHIFQAWLAPPAGHADYPALALLNTILGAGGLSARLFLELRDKQGLAYNVRSSYDTYRYKGLFYLYIGTEPANKEKCLAGFQDECRKLLEIPVGADELADAKRNILGRRSIFLETIPQQANYVGSNVALGRTLEDIQRIPERLQSVTADDIQRVANIYLTQPSVVSIVGPSAIL